MDTTDPVQPVYASYPSDFYLEKNTVKVACRNNNVAPFHGTVHWFDPMNISIGFGGLLLITDISRSQAGIYMCDVTLLNQSISVDIPALLFTLVVYCKYHFLEFKIFPKGWNLN